jgi:hypothetical protein
MWHWYHRLRFILLFVFFYTIITAKGTPDPIRKAVLFDDQVREAQCQVLKILELKETPLVVVKVLSIAT